METKTSFGFNHPSILNEITKSCEKLITETQIDLENFRSEQQQFKLQMLDFYEENTRIKSKLESQTAEPDAANIGDCKDDVPREQLANEAFNNVRKQIELLQSENNDLLTLNHASKKTIANLERELETYQNRISLPSSTYELKQKYAAAIQCLENTIARQNSELRDQTHYKEGMAQQLLKRIDHLESVIKEKDKELQKFSESNRIIGLLKQQLNESHIINAELQQTLKGSQLAVEELFKREQNALQKVEEAVYVAEAATTEKEEILKREKIVKEEYKDIASTIGHVMDEVASKVERSIKGLKKEFARREKALIDEKAKIADELQNQKKHNGILEKRCCRFEQKYQDILSKNEELSQKLGLAAKYMYETEQNISAQEDLEKNSEDEHQRDIMHFVETNKELTERYRVTLCEMTKPIEQKLHFLQNEVSNLKAENHALKSQCSNPDEES